MLKLGTYGIGGMYIGANEIVKAYIGSDLVFDNSGGNVSPVLPAGYTLVEYIENPVNESTNARGYIDTGVYCTQDTKCEIKYRLISTSSFAVFGTRYAENDNTLSIWGGLTGNWRMDDATRSMNSSAGVDYEVTINKDGIVRNGTSYSWSKQIGEFTSVRTIRMFTGSGIQICNARFYYCKIYDNSLVRYMLPCVNSSNETGMYDIVNDVFYGSANGNGFSAGPSI